MVREVAAKTLQERPGFIERIADRACLAKFKCQRVFNHDANSSRPRCFGARADGHSKGSCDAVVAGPVALRQRLDHSETTPGTVGSTATVLLTIRKLLSGAVQSAGYEGSSAVTPRSRRRHETPIGITTTA